MCTFFGLPVLVALNYLAKSWPSIKQDLGLNKKNK